MNTKEVFEETGRIGNEISKERKKIEGLNKRCLELMNLCSHELVFKYNDNHPRKLLVDGNYFCPACGKTVRCFTANQINETSFKSSRIIPLNNLSLIGSKEVYSAIRIEVFNDMDFYYNKNIDDEEISSRMEAVLKDYKSDYGSRNKTLKKMLR